MAKVIISSRLKELRAQLGFTQDQIAQICNVTVQAVSKWECDLSYPDIQLLPILADTFHVTLDDLLCGAGQGAAHLGGTLPGGAFPNDARSASDAYPADASTGGASTESVSTGGAPCSVFPDDDVLRVVQYRGRTLLDKREYDPNVKIPLLIPQENPKNRAVRADGTDPEQGTDAKDLPIRIEIWGSASVDGDISGDVTAGAGVDCGNIGGSAMAGAGLSCGNIGGSATAGTGISCGNVEGNANAGTSVSCGDVGGCVSAGADISCGDVGKSVSSGAEVNCGDVGGCVSAGADVSCGDVNGSVDIGGDLECKNIAGDVHLGGDLHCESIRGTVKRK